MAGQLFRNPVVDVGQGLYLACKGVYLCFQNVEVQEILVKSLFFLFISSVLIMGVSHIVLLPLQIVFMILDFVLGTSFLNISRLLDEYAHNLVLLLTLITISLVQHIGGPIGLKLYHQISKVDADAKIHQVVYNQDGSAYWDFKQIISRMSQLYSQSISIWLIGFVPLVGSNLASVLHIIFIVRQWGKKLPWQTLLIGFIFSYSRFTPHYIMELCLALKMMCRELFDIYFSKLNLPCAVEDQIIRRNAWLLLGFIVPFMALVYTPYVGPLFFIIAQASSSLVADEIEIRARKHIQAE